MQLLQRLNKIVLLLVKAQGIGGKELKKKAESTFLLSALFLCPAILFNDFIPLWLSIIIQIVWFLAFITGCILYTEYKKEKR